MSSVAITGNASGAGVFTIASPNSASSFTATLPAVTGTLLSDKTPGTVLQVVSTSKTDTFTTTSTSYIDVTGMSVSITPTSATSKILVFVNLNASVTASDIFFAFQLVRGSTAISIGDTAGSRTVGSVGSALINGTGSGNYILPMAINFLDSPATTLATTYKIQGLVQTAQTLVLNRSGTDSNAISGIRTASTITVMEIAA
jgi:hypothetical protein